MGLGQQTSVGIMSVSEEIAALRAEKETIRRETDVLKAKLEEAKRQLKRSNSETMDRPMLPRLERPQQLALTAAPAVEVTTDTRVFPDTAAPDSSVERATTKLTSAARPSSKISGERKASTGTLFPLAIRYYNNNSNSSNNIIRSSNSRGNGSSCSSNDTTSNHDS